MYLPNVPNSRHEKWESRWSPEYVELALRPVLHDYAPSDLTVHQCSCNAKPGDTWGDSRDYWLNQEQPRAGQRISYQNLMIYLTTKKDISFFDSLILWAVVISMIAINIIWGSSHFVWNLMNKKCTQGCLCQYVCVQIWNHRFWVFWLYKLFCVGKDM